MVNATKPEWDNACTQVGACALTGAVAFFAGIPDAAVVVNGPLWCSFYARRYLERQCPSLAERFFCSQADNEAVVYGTEACLTETLATVREKCATSVILIINSCSVGLIGDDLPGIARQVDLPCPAVCMDGGGLSGGFWDGYRAAAKAYFVQASQKTRVEIEPWTVNLLGLSVGYYNAGNDLREMQRILALGGYRIQTCPGLGSTVQEIETLGRAEINVVVHEELGGELARQLEAAYSMPYVSLLPPYGIDNTLDWINTIGLHMKRKPRLATNLLQQEADSRQQEIRMAVTDMERIWGDLWFENAMVAAPSSVAMGLARALRQEWADVGTLTMVAHDGRPKGALPQQVDCVLDGTADSEEIQNCLTKLEGGLLLGSGSEKAFLRQRDVQGAVACNIALPVYDEVILDGCPSMGLHGGVRWLERLWNGYAAERYKNKKSREAEY